MAAPDLTGIGSGDLREVMQELDNAQDYRVAKSMMKGGDSNQTETAIEHIREVTGRRFAQLLLARLLLLHLLVEEACELSDGLQVDVHQRLWLLLQVQPQLFDKGPGIPLHNVFSSITWSL